MSFNIDNIELRKAVAKVIFEHKIIDKIANAIASAYDRD